MRRPPRDVPQKGLTRQTSACVPSIPELARRTTPAKTTRSPVGAVARADPMISLNTGLGVHTISLSPSSTSRAHRNIFAATLYYQQSVSSCPHIGMSLGQLRVVRPNTLAHSVSVRYNVPPSVRHGSGWGGTDVSSAKDAHIRASESPPILLGCECVTVAHRRIVTTRYLRRGNLPPQETQ